MSSDQISNIVQDKFGYLWIGTSDGLNRFDGKSFTVYRHAANDSNSLSNNIINALSADNSGKIWAATNDGLCYYNFSDDRFHSIDVRRGNHETLDRDRVHALVAGKNNVIWYATHTELHAFFPNGVIQTYTLPVDDRLDILTLAEDHSDRIWIGTNISSVIVFDEKTRKCSVVHVNRNPDKMNNNTEVDLAQIFENGQDSLWVGTWSAGLQLLTMKNDVAKLFPFTDRKEPDARKWIVLGMAQSNTPDQLWLATYGSGLALFDLKSGNFVNHIHHDPSDATSLCNDFCNCVFTDMSGTLWVGTNSGLDKYDPLMHQFAWVPIPDFAASSSIRKEADDVIENLADASHQTIWISVSGTGLFLYNRKTGEFKLFHHIDGDDHSLLSDNVNVLFNDVGGKLWVGTHDGVCMYDAKKNDFEKISINSSSSFTPTSISGFLEDKNQRIWISTYSSGIFCYMPSSRQLISFHHVEDHSQSLPDDHVFCMLEDHAGRIWAGTQNLGLCRLDESTGNWKYYHHQEGNNQSLPTDYIYSLLEDGKHQLWIATENGLAVMNLNDETIHNYSTTDGLCNNDIFSFHFDRRHHLWLATNNGLSDFDPQTKTFKNYFTADGLQTNHIGGAFSIMHDGTIYFGTPGGMSYFNPEALKTNHRIPQVVITTFNIFDRPVSLARHETQLLPIRLSYQQNMIGFNFAALNFTNANSNHYAYRLDGFDQNWIDCGNRTSATYTNLNGGDYVFRVKAANNDGVWNETGASVILHISNPFWKTGWFYTLITIAIASVLYAIYRVRINQILKLQQIRTRIARDLHDDIGSTLSSISMMSQLGTKTSPADQEKSKALFATISKASRQAMDLMSDIVWSVNPKNDRMENIIIRMREYASEILDAAKIDFRLESDAPLHRIQLSMDKRKDFFLIFKEAVNNLAKYSGADHVVFRLSADSRHLAMQISDDGKGFDVSQKFSGNGIKNMQARAALSDGDLTIQSSHGKGTTILLRMPFIP